MDSRLRGRARDWRADGSPEAQAAAIQEAIRFGKLDHKRVQLAAFLGHTASRLIADGVRPTGIVVNDTLLKTEQIKDLPHGLTSFGQPAVFRVNLALVRMAFATLDEPERYRGPRGVIRLIPRGYKQASVRIPESWIRLATYSNGATGEVETRGVSAERWYNLATLAINGDVNAHKMIISLSSDENNLFRDRFFNRWNSYIPIPVSVLNIANEGFLTGKARPKLLKFCNGFYDDATILKFMRSDVLPWALGDFYEGSVEPPTFVCYPPFRSRRRT